MKLPFLRPEDTVMFGMNVPLSLVSEGRFSAAASVSSLLHLIKA